MNVNNINIVDKVIFDSNKIEDFRKETDNVSKEIQQYRKFVLAGITQVGVAVEFIEEMTTVKYPDGWELPIPSKYLIKIENT